MATSRVCVFCGGSGLTKEHVWPQWLNALPEVHGPDPQPHVRRPHVVLGMTRDPATGFPVHHPEQRGTEQPPWDLQVRVVCGRCNSGWMAARERRIKPLLRPFFDEAETFRIRAPELTRLAAWAVRAPGRDRNVVERNFNTVKQWRGLATRYDKLAIVYRGGAVLRAITIWTRAFGDTP